ncbi:NTP transferase domain-containing protein [Gemelliphila palaticanis]|uniref:NTP transferase domain-containing protein n=1 Tax=Gemelliphila palaticanis TaxID=81950 RepID=A0ABX2T2C8_9BACL|nr:NTP transferase domain-containing protein [Gemella palaticanis]MBF0715435.1 NTP transferase domain-containing protein [Gemella palaticanis]NYS47365.1 NTP transferase domain-containing protein [Gemella palaticanis]
MLNLSQFNVLKNLKIKKYTQRELSKDLNISLGKVNSIITYLKDKKYIDLNLNITGLGLDKLNYYKVNNAVILAAGMSSRFVPLSYEKPKGLLKVKGELLIERQIKQLKEKGIDDITLVVGYMKEKMFYLSEKYNVNIIVNENYHKYNNTSSMILVKDILKNTYICSSDNYFVENPFEEYVYQGYYSCVFEEGDTKEYCVEFDNKDIIKKVSIGGKDSWVMLGHVYFDKNFSSKFSEILEYNYNNISSTKEKLWEDVYIENIGKLNLIIKKYDSNIIKEFDSLEDLRLFDEKYVKNADSSIFKNISRILDCKDSDIYEILPIKEGMTNTSFSFMCKNIKYVYRHPGVGTEEYINRASEAASMSVAKELGLDDTIIYIDEIEGWKLSYFVEDVVSLDYRNDKHVDKALNMLKILHTSNKKTKYEFNIWNEIEKFKNKLDKINRSDFEDMSHLMSIYDSLRFHLNNDNFDKCLCHGDSYAPNFLIDKNFKMYLIDWEYSGMADPASDLGTFIACSDYTLEEAINVIEKYFGRECSEKEIRHYLGYISVISFYWFLWALNQESKGKIVGEYTYIWYKYTKLYGKKSLDLYKN